MINLNSDDRASNDATRGRPTTDADAELPADEWLAELRAKGIISGGEGLR